MPTEYFHSCLLIRHCCACLAIVLSFIVFVGSPHDVRAGSKPSLELIRHLTEIARLAQPSPMVTIPAGPFMLGSKQVNDDPYGNWKPFDDTELPQHRIWLDTYWGDQGEASRGEYLACF